MALASETAAAAVIVEATSVEVEYEVPHQEEATQPPPPPPSSETQVEAAFVHIEESLNKSVENVEEEVARLETCTNVETCKADPRQPPKI